jgi:acetyl esterase/lipase
VAYSGKFVKQEVAMPIGYAVHAGIVATVALSAAARHRPRQSSPIRLSYLFGLQLNWPLVAFGLLLASTALAATERDSLVFWIGLGLAVLASAGLWVLRRRAQRTGSTIERALDEGLGSGWRDSVDAGLAGRLHRRPSLTRVLLAPITARRQGVERIANIRYGPARRGNVLDLYRRRSDVSGRPALVYLHPGGFRMGSKRFGARHLFYRLASRGWVCISANYRLYPATFPDPLIDAKKVIAWVREHGPEYGVDPTTVFIAGSSAGGHLASTAALTPNDPVFQPGFEEADTTVAGAVSLYGYYGPVSSDELPSSPHAYANVEAPPFFVVHGDQDTLVVVDDARRFVEELRAASNSPVVYAELAGAQHGFDLFRSRRFDSVIDAIEAFTSYVRSRHRAPETRTQEVDTSSTMTPRHARQ